MIHPVLYPMKYKALVVLFLVLPLTLLAFKDTEMRIRSDVWAASEVLTTMAQRASGGSVRRRIDPTSGTIEAATPQAQR